MSAGRLARVSSSGVLNSVFNENIGSSANGGFNNSVRAITLAANGDLLVGGDFTGATAQFAVPVTNVALAAQIVTLKTSSPHGFTNGATAVIQSVNAGFNGNFQVLAVADPLTFSYLLDRTNTIVNKLLTGGIATLTANASHGLQVGNFVQIAGVHPRLDGAFPVTATPSLTTFTYNRPYLANITTKALAGGTATITTAAAHGYDNGDQMETFGP